jgi:serine protease
LALLTGENSMKTIRQSILISIALFMSAYLFSQQLDADFKTTGSNASQISASQQPSYIEKTIIIKVKSEFRSVCDINKIDNNRFNQLYQSIGGTGLNKKFPAAKIPNKLVNERGESLADLSLIYEFTYSAPVSVEKIISKCVSLQLFEYAEPHYIQQLCYTPNDPSLSTQYAITNIQAEAAWGINTTTARGDSNIVIGIVDTGVDPNHEDLQSKIKHNYADVIGGGDDDNDGYVDNFSGWDLGENDNDPTYNANPHGVHVSGIAAAATDNAKGVAGIGFNCKFLPVKIANASGVLTQSYEGIVYAVDHGCSIINCSWGSETASQLGQDIINYATINNNVLVVAAAGNNSLDEPFYPAAFQYVISVANTKSDDRRSSSSNYNYTVDVCAPGESINSTFPANTYSLQTGTSMSSPCVAGAAAIVKSFYPSYTALQVGERLKTTCDNIYSLMSPIYANKLGNGRINLYNALTQAVSPSVKETQRSITDNNDNTFAINDTLRIRDVYTNYLGSTTNLTVTLSTTSAFVSILDGTTALGSIPTLGTATNNSDPYTIKIVPNAPPNQVVQFKLTYSDPGTSYTAYEFFSVVVNVDYINININDIATTISSAGRIGYSQNSQGGGLGFNYLNGGTLFYESGLMVGVSGSQVSDAVRGATVPEADFQSLTTAHSVEPAVLSDFDVDGTFKDNLATSPLPVTVHHKAFAWNSVGDQKYIIVQYTIANTGTTTLTNLFAGVFTDWDIDAATYASNRASFDAANQMGYAYYTGTNGKYGGVKLLTHTAPVLHYAIDNVSGGAGGVDMLAGGYDGNEKYVTLSTNRSDAGVGAAGNDVIDVVSTGPYAILAGDSIKVAFAIIAGDNLTDLQTSAQHAQTKYDGINTNTTTSILNNTTDGTNRMMVYPNPSVDETKITIDIAEESSVSLKILDVMGKEIVIVNENRMKGQYQFIFNSSGIAAGIYYCQLTVGNKKSVQKLIVTK